MSRRLVRIAVAGFCLLSLLACLGAAWMWARSHRNGTTRFAFLTTKEGSYALTSRQGWLTLVGPPPADAAHSARARELVARLRNEDVACDLVCVDRRDHFRVAAGDTYLEPQAAADDLLRLPKSETTRPLLKAIGDPERFAAAHIILTVNLGENASTKLSERPESSAAVDTGVSYNGLRVQLYGKGAVRGQKQKGEPLFDYAYRGPAAVRIDPAQWPAIRSYWHSRLDATFASVRYWWLVAVTAAPSLLWLGARARRLRVRRRRRRLKLCLRCGYDLRESPSRCPECGTVALEVKP